MMFREDKIAWCEFTSLDDRTLPAYVRADAVCGIARADHSGTTITLIGGGTVRVHGDPATVRKRLDAFLDQWDENRHDRNKARDERLEALRAAKVGQ